MNITNRFLAFSIAVILSACGGGGGGGESSVAGGGVTVNQTTYSVGGTVSGLPAGVSLIIENNRTETLTISANGKFTFATRLTSGSTFGLTITKQPTEVLCSAKNESGKLESENVANIIINCTNTTVFASSPTLLPDLQTIYQKICGVPLSLTFGGIGVQSISVLNMAGHKDGKKDLIFTLWCGQIGGTPYTGPTYNGAIFFEQNSDGSFSNTTRQMFGVDLLDVGGVANNSLVADFNGDGIDDVVFSITGEDGRLEQGDLLLSNLRKNFYLLSESKSKYVYEARGLPSYSSSVMPVENQFGSVDVVNSIYGSGTAQAWRYANGWKELSGYSWFSPGSFFFKKESKDSAANTALRINDVATGEYLSVELRKRDSPDGKWNVKDFFPLYFRKVPNISWQKTVGSGPLFSINGRDYFGGGFQMGCELKLAPNKQPMAFVIFYSKLLTSNYVGGDIVDDIGMSPASIPFGFEISNDKLINKNINIQGWDNTLDPFKLECIDINKDGFDDIVIYPGGIQDGKPSVFLNDGLGNFSLLNKALFPDKPSYYVLTTSILKDIDGDGVADLIYMPLSAKSNNSKMQYVIHKGTRQFRTTDTQ